ncbi:MAG: Uncharacterized protein XD52_1404 [bacterium 42_11]|nr:MAG: Uncharacterized protein XD52_1404 [bacterium 42_11]
MKVCESKLAFRFRRIIDKLPFGELLELERLKEALKSLSNWDLKKEEGVLEALFKSSILNLLARTLGYLKNFAIAILLGFSVKTDGYFMALSLLGIFLIFADVFDSIGVPNLVKARQKNMEEFKKLSGLLFTFTLILATLSTIFAVLLMPFILKVPVGFKEEALAYTKSSYLILIPYVFLSFIFYHFGAVLRSLRRFTVYFLGEFIISVCSFIVVTLGLLYYRDYWVLPLSLTISQALATLFMVFKVREFLHIEFYMDDRIKSLLKQFLQLSALYGVFHLYMVVDRAFGSMLGEKAVSALTYGLMLAIASKNVLRIESLAITSLSEAGGSLEKLNFYVKRLLLLSVPFSILLFSFSEYIVGLLLGYGAFSKVDVALTSEALRFYSLSVPFIFLWLLVYRVFQIREKMGKLVKLAVTGVFLNGGLNYLFVIELKLGIPGICLGTLVAYVFLSLFGYSMLDKQS